MRFALSSLMCIFLSCCCTNYFTYNGGGELQLIDTSGIDIESVTGPFELIALFEIVQETADASSLISSAYATSCDNKYRNGIIGKYMRLTVDEPFIYDSTLIDLGQNILELNGIDTMLRTGWDYSGSLNIMFTDSFMTRAKFDAETAYRFTLTGRTSDNQPIDLSTEVSFNLE